MSNVLRSALETVTKAGRRMVGPSTTPGRAPAMKTPGRAAVLALLMAAGCAPQGSGDTAGTDGATTAAPTDPAEFIFNYPCAAAVDGSAFLVQNGEDGNGNPAYKTQVTMGIDLSGALVEVAGGDEVTGCQQSVTGVDGVIMQEYGDSTAAQDVTMSNVDGGTVNDGSISVGSENYGADADESFSLSFDATGTFNGGLGSDVIASPYLSVTQDGTTVYVGFGQAGLSVNCSDAVANSNACDVEVLTTTYDNGTVAAE